MPRLALALVVIAAVSGCALSDRVYETFTVHRPKRGVDVNHAPPEEIAHILGIDDEDAERIVRARPFDVKSDLVRRGVVSEKEYEQIQARVYVGRVAPGEEPNAAVRRPAEHRPEDGD
jgi:DNA uptake protein ComE-like DNA-binding protein